MLAYLLRKGTVSHMTVDSHESQYKLFMNISAVLLLIIGLFSIGMIAYFVQLIVSDQNPKVQLTAIWIAALWAILSFTAAAWCRLQGMRADATQEKTDTRVSDTDASTALLKGFEEWMIPDSPEKAPINSYSSTD